MTKSSVFPLHFCGHCWLESLPVGERAVEIWPSMETYVDAVKSKKIPNPGSSSFDTIAVSREDPLILPKLNFFMAVSRTFQPFLEKYQTDQPVMPFLHKDLTDLLKVIFTAFCFTNVLKHYLVIALALFKFKVKNLVEIYTKYICAIFNYAMFSW